jgi:hypothetical protein
METKFSRQLLAKFTIQSDKRGDFRKEVLRRGVDEHFVSADLDGLGKRLTRELHEEMVHYAIS